MQTHINIRIFWANFHPLNLSDISNVLYCFVFLTRFGQAVYPCFLNFCLCPVQLSFCQNSCVMKMSEMKDST